MAAKSKWFTKQNEKLTEFVQQTEFVIKTLNFIESALSSDLEEEKFAVERLKTLLERFPKLFTEYMEQVEGLVLPLLEKISKLRSNKVG